MEFCGESSRVSWRTVDRAEGFHGELWTEQKGFLENCGESRRVSWRTVERAVGFHGDLPFCKSREQ